MKNIVVYENDMKNRINWQLRQEKPPQIIVREGDKEKILFS